MKTKSVPLQCTKFLNTEGRSRLSNALHRAFFMS